MSGRITSFYCVLQNLLHFCCKSSVIVVFFLIKNEIKLDDVRHLEQKVGKVENETRDKNNSTKRERCFFVLSRAWDKENISESPWGIEPQIFGFRAPMLYHWATDSTVSESPLMGTQNFFLSHARDKTKKHLSLFLYRAQNLPSFLFLST